MLFRSDTTALRSDKAWTEGVNRWLPNDVAVRWVAHPGTEFDARFSAQSRTYRYLLFVDPFVNPFIDKRWKNNDSQSKGKRRHNGEHVIERAAIVGHVSK